MSPDTTTVASGVSIRYATASGTGSWWTAMARTRTRPSSLVQTTSGRRGRSNAQSVTSISLRARVRGPERKVVFVRLEHATDETSGDALGRHDDQGTG